MKKKLMDMLAKKNTRKQEINALVEKSQDVEELRKLSAELDSLNTELRSLQEMIDALPEEPETQPQSHRTQAVNGQVPGVVTAGVSGQEQRNLGGQEIKDPFATLEYRKACSCNPDTLKNREMQPEYRLDAMINGPEVRRLSCPHPQIQQSQSLLAIPPDKV